MELRLSCTNPSIMISIHSFTQIFIVMDHFKTETVQLIKGTVSENEIIFLKQTPRCLRVKTCPWYLLKNAVLCWWLLLVWRACYCGASRNVRLWMGWYRLDTITQWALITRFMGPTWGPSGADRTQVGSMLVPWTLLSGRPGGAYVHLLTKPSLVD